MRSLRAIEDQVERQLSSLALTAPLVQSTASKYITYTLIVAFVVVLLYETLYWSGIYLGLWEYHAREIFKEVPVHCAHIYVRLGSLDSEANLQELQTHFASRSYIHKHWWNRFVAPPTPTTTITYHFEFGPEDFEKNESPELGLTVGQLLSKILSTYKDSPLRQTTKNFSQVVIFNHNYELLDSTCDEQYLGQSHIETGDLINCYIL